MACARSNRVAGRASDSHWAAVCRRTRPADLRSAGRCRCSGRVRRAEFAAPTAGVIRRRLRLALSDGADVPVITYAEAAKQAIVEEMRRDPRVFVMGQDVQTSSYADAVQEFGHERVRNTPISECGFYGAGIGAA